MFISNPSILNINDNNISNSPCCNNILLVKKENAIITIKNDHGCKYHNDESSFFGYPGYNYKQCTCNNIQQEIIKTIFTCKTCTDIVCRECNKKIKCNYSNCILNNICDKCKYMSCNKCNNLTNILSNKDLNKSEVLCGYCNSSKCYKCKQIICDSGSDLHILCDECKLFIYQWKNSTPIEKLSFYGLAKLKILARKKNIKIGNIRKDELIAKLSQVVKDSDFPIN